MSGLAFNVTKPGQKFQCNLSGLYIVEGKTGRSVE